jgi:hypothetical protein
MGARGPYVLSLRDLGEEKMKKYTGMGVENQIFQAFNSFQINDLAC